MKRVSVFEESLAILSNAGIVPYYSIQTERSIVDVLESLPFGATPEGGRLPNSRCWRKNIQVRNMIEPVTHYIHFLNKLNITKKNIKVVEFCAGSGFLILPLACLFPEVQFVLIDLKSKSIEIAKDRINQTHLKNVKVLEQNIQNYNEPFDIGIALHACGDLSDVVIDKCLAANAMYCICPCCTGKITRSSPRSKAFRDALYPSSLQTTNDIEHNVDYSSLDSSTCRSNRKGAGYISGNRYISLVQASDIAHSFELSKYSQIDRKRRIAKTYLEFDRELYVHEVTDSGYHTSLSLMQPCEASPKNDILLGWPLRHSDVLQTFSLNPVKIEYDIAGFLFRQQS